MEIYRNSKWWCEECGVLEYSDGKQEIHSVCKIVEDKVEVSDGCWYCNREVINIKDLEENIPELYYKEIFHNLQEFYNE